MSNDISRDSPESIEMVCRGEIATAVLKPI
jgi:hypothetical protein